MAKKKINNKTVYGYYGPLTSCVSDLLKEELLDSLGIRSEYNNTGTVNASHQIIGDYGMALKNPYISVPHKKKKRTKKQRSTLYLINFHLKYAIWKFRKWLKK